MPLTDKVADVIDYLFNLINTNKASLGLLDVFSADQEKLPRTPAMTLSPGRKSRTLNGAPRRTLVDLEVYGIVYIESVASISANQALSDTTTEAVETLIHTDPNFGGIVIHSMVEDIEYGYAIRGSELLRCARMTITARSQVQLPMVT